MALYQEIYDEIKAAIESGRFLPGARLPSIRDVAAQRGCNKLTVKKAFDRLKAAGFIENRVGSGSFVRYPDSPTSETQRIYPFHSAYIAAELFPTDSAAQIMEELFRKENGLFGAGPIGGDSGLLQVLSERYRVPAKTSLIISGAQQGLNLCSSLYNLKISEQMVFEDPTYSGAISVFKPTKFVPLLEDGPDLTVLKEVAAKGARFFYTMPEVHNPTGITYSEEKIRRIAEIAREYDLILIEDDYLSEFIPNRLLRFVDLIPERTIYIKSLSKVSAPGIRLGFMTVPPELYQKVLYKKYSADIGTTALMQKFLTRFIQAGLLDEHIAYCRGVLQRRKRQILTVLAKYPFLHIDWKQTGYNLWVRTDFPLNVSSPPWAEGRNFSLSPQMHNFMRLSLLGMDDAEFAHGTAYLDSLFGAMHAGYARPVL
ncbi:MAG: PLP-dependent aminotransferase family protein [Spirochaetota bacterium]